MQDTGLHDMRCTGHTAEYTPAFKQKFFIVIRLVFLIIYILLTVDKKVGALLHLSSTEQKGDA
jgi:hypothetical protein